MDSRRTADALALGGYLVMAFDQVGFATRILQGSQAFYRRCGAGVAFFLPPFKLFTLLHGVWA